MNASDRVLVRAPATAANLGPGMDALGLALGLHNTFAFRLGGEAVVVEARGPGSAEVPAGAGNLAVVAFQSAREALGLPPVRGLHVACEVAVPPRGGLGSSATAVVAGILAAEALAGASLTRTERHQLATHLEGHPDNVIPCCEGGLCVALASEGRAPTVLRALPEAPPALVALIPRDLRLSTAAMREVLPRQVPWRDAVRTAGCAALLVFALLRGERGALATALDDRLHEPYRARCIPGFAEVRAAARAAGALGTVLSGSGPTLLVFGEDAAHARAAAEAGRAAWAAAGVSADARPLPIDGEGAEVVRVAPTE
ncbi:MAG: homoserine kinase [Planctomycetota bacterium]|nr:MAG: homoserine kinase [Planctomycetota bacterium]